jgi:hypothetical protein
MRYYAIAALALTAALCGGCTIEDLVRAPVPKPIQVELGTPAEVPASRMPELREQYAQAVADKAAAAAAEKAEAVRQIESKARAVASSYQARIAALVAEQNAQLAEFAEAGARETAKLEQQAREAEASAKRALSSLAASEGAALSKVESIKKLIGGLAELAAPGITAAFPAAGPLLTLGLGAFLWTRKRPGEDATLAEEKQASFNKGLREGAEAAIKGKGSA